MFDLVTEDGLSRDRTGICQLHGSVVTTFVSRAPVEGYSSQDSTRGGAWYVPLQNEEKYLRHYYYELHDDTGRLYFFYRSPRLEWRLNFASRFWNRPFEESFESTVGLRADHVILSGGSYIEAAIALTTAICRKELGDLCCCEWGPSSDVQKYVKGTIESANIRHRCRMHLFRLRSSGSLNDPSTGKFSKAMALHAKRKWFGEFGVARNYVQWQLKVPVSESIPEEVKKWRWETGAAVPGTTVCMYDAA